MDIRGKTYSNQSQEVAQKSKLIQLILLERNKRGLSQEDLGRLAKCSQERISEIENANPEKVMLDSLVKVLVALGFCLHLEPRDDLFT